MKIVLTLVFAALLAGCAGVETKLELEDWGPARDELLNTARFQVEDLQLPDRVDGDLEPEDRAEISTRWPRWGAEELAQGMSDEDVPAGTDGGRLRVRTTIETLDVGRGGGRYWGTGGASLVIGTIELVDEKDQLAARLRFRHQNLRDSTGLAFPRDCWQLGRKLAFWIEDQR